MNPRLKLWFGATRPFSFTASIVPVVVGTLVAAPKAFNPFYFILALLGSVLIHAGTNLVNDYYDHVKGVDGPDSLGPRNAIRRGLISPGEVLRLGIACFVLGSLCGLALVGPVMVLGAYYVQTAHWSWDPFIVSLPIAFLVTAILHANNLRDIDDDRRHGKRTLATIIGRRPANWAHYLLIGATYASLIVMVATRVAPWPVLLTLLTAPAALQAVRLTARTKEPRRLNYVLFRTAQLHMRFGALLAAGLAAGLVVPH